MSARIVLADDGIPFDDDSLDAGPLGGAESAFISLGRAFAARGNEVAVRNRCAGPALRNGVDWAPLDHRWPDSCDLYIANRGHRLIGRMRRARRRVFWIHNPAGYLLKWRYLSRIWRFQPTIVFAGPYHAATYPAWAPGRRRVVIPLGLSAPFLAVAPATEPPPPRAIFTSNPLRSLDWLLDLWVGAIHPRVPGAELHLYTGPATYGAAGAALADYMSPVLTRAARLRANGVILREPRRKAELAVALAGARVMLYRGDPGESFCLAVAEAQASGVPAVVQDIGSVAERVVDGVTGCVAADDASFADAACRLLTDDGLWRAYSRAAAAAERHWSWDRVAASFEELIG